MKHKREIIEGLLAQLAILEKFPRPPEEIADIFVSWYNNVAPTLENANMIEELEVWKKTNINVRFSDDEILDLVMNSARTSLLTILNRLTYKDIFSMTSTTPFISEHDVLSAQKMSELYIVLHCYENSVRKLIETTLSKAHGENWWDSDANQDMNTKYRERKVKEEKNRWLSPRGTTPLYYLDWSHLVTLIRKFPKDFEPFIPNIKFIELRLEELELLRNIVAHHGIIPSDDDYQRVILSFQDWCRQVTIPQS